MERKTKARAATGIYLVIVAAILVFANIISFGLYKRFDTTKNERFTLSDGSGRLVKELSQELQVEVFVTSGLPKHDAFIQDITDMMTEYERAGEGKFKYTIIEAKTDEEIQRAKDAGLQEAAFGDVKKTGKDQALITKGYMGLSLKYGSEKAAIPLLNPEQAQGLEFWISNKIREIRDKAENRKLKIGVLTGKDEIKLTDANLIAAGRGGQGPNIKQILDQNFPFYEFEDVDLQAGESEINKELTGLIITQPGKDFTEKELRRIDQFLMLGKSVAIFAGAVNIKASDEAMKAELNTRGLEKLVEGYGIEMKKEAILDWGRSLSIPYQTQSGPVYYPMPGVVLAVHDTRFDEKEQTLDTGFAGFFRIDEISFPFPSTLVAHPEKQPEATMKVVARSTPKSTVDSSDAIEMKPAAEWKPKGEAGQRVMGIVLEGKIKSAFGGQDALGITTAPVSLEKAGLLMVSASQFFTNPFARAGNAPPMPPQMAMMGPMGGNEDLQTLARPYAERYLTSTILSFKNILDWLGGDTDLLATSAKLIGESTLSYSDVEKPKEMTEATLKDYDKEREQVQEKVQWWLILFGPVLFAAFGIARWRMRESARARNPLD